MKRAILLAGLHKTGTTSIQRTFRKHADEIEKLGFTYPLLTLKVGNPDAFPENHSKLLQGMFARHVGGPGRKTDNPFRERMQKDVDQFLRTRGVKNLILAAENLSTMPASDLLDLKRWLEQGGFDVEVYCSVRHIRPWLASMLGQRVIGVHGPRLTLAQTFHEFESSSGIAKPRIEVLTNVFPNVRIFNFENSIRHRRGPFGNFVEMIGIAGLDHIEPVHANEGKSDHAVRINSLINEALGPRTDHGEAYVRLLKSQPALQSIPGRKFQLRAHEAKGLLPKMVSENEWLISNYGAEFGDEKIGLNDGAPTLEPETRKFLEANFRNADPWLGTIIRNYVDEFDKPARPQP